MSIYKSGEDYLEAILMLQKRIGRVRSIDIVNELEYSKPSVSIAMKKLRETGYIVVEGDGSIILTDKGLEIATQIYNRHETITEFLIKIGVSEEIARDDACKIEHTLSEETFKKLQEHVKTF